MEEAVLPHAGARRDRHPQVLQRPGVVHARQPVPAGRGARAARLLRRRRLQLRRHRLGRRRGPGAGRVDRRRARPTTDLVGVDIRRFAPFHGDVGVAARRAWPRCSACTTRSPGRNREPETGRPSAALAAARPRWRRRAPSSASKMGWERPYVFAPDGSSRRTGDYAWGKPAWLPWHGVAEQRATRDGGRGLRPDVVQQVRRRRPGRARRPAVGRARTTSTCRSAQAVYTPMLNARGTYESDLTVTRTGDDEFLLVSSAATTVRDLDWIDAHRRCRRRGSASPTSPRTSPCSA